MKLDGVPEPFRTRLFACLENTKTLTRSSLISLLPQYFSAPFDPEVDDDTYRIMIAVKMAADESRELGEKVPSSVLFLLTIAKERECSSPIQ